MKPDRSLETQDKLFEALRRVKQEYPNWRTGQIIVNISNAVFYPKGQARSLYKSDETTAKLFNVEDNILADIINEWLEKRLIEKLAGIK